MNILKLDVIKRIKTKPSSHKKRKTMNATTSIDDTSNEEGGHSYFNVFSTIYLAFVVVVGSTLNTQALFLLRDATKVS